MKEGIINPINESQLRTEQAEKVLRFIDKTDIYSYAKNFLDDSAEKPSFEEFKNFLIRINGIARDIPISRRSFDGKNVYLSGMSDVQVPKHEDKEEILKYAYDSFEDIAKRDLKYLIPGLINAIHFFADGNGRTSRTVNQLLSEHKTKDDFQKNLKTCLGKEGRFDSINVDPDLIHDDIQKIILDKNGWKMKDERYCLGDIFRTANREFRELDINIESYSNLKKFYTLTRGVSDQAYALTALSVVLGPRVNELLADNYIVKGNVSFHKMAEKVTKEEWKSIFEEYFKLKKEHVKMFVDIFSQPDKYKSEESEANLKDKFIASVEQVYQNNL